MVVLSLFWRQRSMILRGEHDNVTKKEFLRLCFLRSGFSKVWIVILLVEAGAFALVSGFYYFSDHFYFLNVNFENFYFWLKLSFDVVLVFWVIALAFDKVSGVKLFSSLLYGREASKILIETKSFCVALRDELFVVVISPTEVIEAKKVRSQLYVLSERVALSWGGSASAWQSVPGLFFSHAWVMVCRK